MRAKFKIGQDVDELVADMKSSGGGDYDEDIIPMFDGDQLQVTMVAPPEGWGTYERHYIQGKGPSAGYRLCRGEDCEYCDAGIRAGKVTLVPVYVHRRNQGEYGDRKAKVTRNVGYKYLILNKETTENFARRFKSRNGKFDRIFIIERSGSDTDTKYDVERTETKVSSSIVKGARKELDVAAKFDEMAEKELSRAVGGTKSSKKSKRVDDDDDDDLDEFDVDDEDEDEPVRKKAKAKKSTATAKKKRRSRED